IGDGDKGSSAATIGAMLLNWLLNDEKPNAADVAALARNAHGEQLTHYTTKQAVGASTPSRVGQAVKVKAGPSVVTNATDRKTSPPTTSTPPSAPKPVAPEPVEAPAPPAARPPGPVGTQLSLFPSDAPPSTNLQNVVRGGP